MMLIMLNEEEVRPKVSAFVTRADGRLLVFAHPESPDAGIQVPAGGIEPGEEPAAAAVRETEEETGFTGFVVERLVDRQLLQERRRGRLDPVRLLLDRPGRRAAAPHP